MDESSGNDLHDISMYGTTQTIADPLLKTWTVDDTLTGNLLWSKHFLSFNTEKNQYSTVYCGPECLYCTIKGYCKSCKFFYHLELGTCVEDSTSSNVYLDKIEREYKIGSACENGCDTTVCKKCNPDGSNDCIIGSFFYNNKCYDDCPRTYYPSGTSCVSCNTADPFNCLECSAVNVCTKCNTGYLLHSQNNGAVYCTSVTCGDGILTAPEECDDANFASGDGCDENCHVESDLFTCSNPNPFGKSICVPICGDGIFIGLNGEQCDDGNKVNIGANVDGDGCNSNCQIEAGWWCVVPVPRGRSYC